MQIYITTNLINGKIYIGQSINNNEKYLGSGVNLKKAINKYGSENFEKKILLEVNTQEELDAAEIYFIKEFNSTNPAIGYNLNQGGQYESRTGTKLHEETKRKISKALIGHKLSEKTRLKISKKVSGMYNKGEKVLGEKNGRYNGNGTTDETRRKLSESRKDTKMTLETRKKISEKNAGSNNGMHGTCAYNKWVENYGKEEADKRNIEKKLKISNSIKGKKMTEEHKRKISEARKQYWVEKKSKS